MHNTNARCVQRPLENTAILWSQAQIWCFLYCPISTSSRNNAYVFAALSDDVAIPKI